MAADLNHYKDLISLSQFAKFGPKKLGRLKSYFPSWEEAFYAPSEDLQRAGIEETLAQEFCAFRKKFDREKTLERLCRISAKIAVLGEEGYPELLEKIIDPPPIIYYRGEIDFPGRFPLAVVGARKYGAYGQKIIDTIVSDLASSGLLIISGLAIGIDALAHQKALDKKTLTIAVLGSGIDELYPARNLRLAEKIIASGGGIISEFPLDYPPLKQNFPLRNRIISGLSLGVLVVEARQKSGSLITAYSALEQGREVFAVPGDIDRENSRGTNDLIKKGAALVSEAGDILEAFGLERVKKEPLSEADLSENEKLILGFLSQGQRNIEELIVLTKLDTKVINSTLSILEIKNILNKTGNNYYLRSSRL